MVRSIVIISAVLSFGSFTSYTIMDIGIQYLLNEYSLFQVMFLNNLYSLIFMGVFLVGFHVFFKDKPKPQSLALLGVWKPKRWSFHLMLATIALVGDILVFYSLKFHSLAEMYTIILTTPIFSALFVFLFYREKIVALKWVCILMSFGASLWALNPSFSGISWALVGVMGTSVLYATWYLIVKYHAQGEGIASIFVSARVFSILFFIVPTVLYWEPVTQSDTWIMIFNGWGYFIGYVLIIMATRLGSISTVSSMHYTQLPLGVLADFLLYAIYPSIVSICAGALIVLGGLLIVYIDRREELRVRRSIVNVTSM